MVLMSDALMLVMLDANADVKSTILVLSKGLQQQEYASVNNQLLV